MEVYRSLDTYKAGKNPVATLGTFDGVHIGHRKILSRLKASADAIGGESVLITFHPHPRLVLFPEGNSLRLLQTLDEKIRILDEYGIDKLLIVPFTREFSRMHPKAFIQEILVDTVNCQKIIIGYDHRFGKNREGGIEKMREYAPQFHYTVEEIPAQAIDDANVSSTKIRNALQEGDIQTANRYLGYAYGFSGIVVHGEKLGRKLGYPTANIQIDDPLKLCPATGVYFVRFFVRKKAYYGMMNIGTKPTVGTFGIGAEVYVFHFDDDIYDEYVSVEILEYLREEKKFDSLETLIKAIDGDRDQSLELIKQYGPLETREERREKRD